MRQLLVCAAISRHHRRRHPASVTHSQPSVAGPRADLRIADSTRRSGGRASPRPLRLPAGDACSGPRFRGHPLPPRLGLLGRRARLWTLFGNDKRDPIQGAENANCILEGFTGVDGQSQSNHSFPQGRDGRRAAKVHERCVTVLATVHPCPDKDQSPRSRSPRRGNTPSAIHSSAELRTFTPLHWPPPQWVPGRQSACGSLLSVHCRQVPAWEVHDGASRGESF